MSHTKGPWRYERGKDNSNEKKDPAWLGTIMSVDDWHVSRIWGDYHTTEECTANAHLIAAAPELLEALERLQVRIFMLEGSENEAYRRARVTIAKAKGQSS